MGDFCLKDQATEADAAATAARIQTALTFLVLQGQGPRPGATRGGRGERAKVVSAEEAAKRHHVQQAPKIQTPGRKRLFRYVPRDLQ